MHRVHELLLLDLKLIKGIAGLVYGVGCHGAASVCQVRSSYRTYKV